jgi:UDP-glucose 4-epimerase
VTEPEAAVIVTGACGRLGKRLVRALHRVSPVISVDRRPFPDRPKDVEHHQVDLMRSALQDVFKVRPVRALLHLGVAHNPRGSPHHTRNVAGFQKLLECAERYAVPKMVLLSSANVYGPRADNAQFLNEDAPLLGSAAFSDIRDLVEVDIMAQSFFWRHPQIETVVLRPSHILGTVRNAPSNYLRLKVAPTLLGFDPMMQVVHQDDVVTALVLALRPGIRGIFNVSGPPPIRLSKALNLLGRARLPVPYSAARFAMDGFWRMRIASFPAPELDYIRFVCMVDDSKARDSLGYFPSYDTLTTLRAVDDERWDA